MQKSHNEILVGLCLQNDLFQISLNHIQKSIEGGIDVISLPGVLNQIAENKDIQEHVFGEYEEIHLYGHRNCAYYDYRGHDGPHNGVQQNLDIHFLKGIFFERIEKLKGDIGFIDEKDGKIFFHGKSYRKQYEDALVDYALVYPVEFWENSFQFMENILKTRKIDRYGYFDSNPELLIKQMDKLKEEIFDISIDKHKAQKVIFLVKKGTQQQSEVYKILDKLSKESNKRRVPSTVFAVSSKTKELIKI